MSRTYGHRISCHRRNCWSCGKGIWRRKDNRERREQGKREIREQVADR